VRFDERRDEFETSYKVARFPEIPRDGVEMASR